MIKTQVAPITPYFSPASPVQALGFVAQLGIHLCVHLINRIQDGSDPREKLMNLLYAFLLFDVFTFL